MGWLWSSSSPSTTSQSANDALPSPPPPQPTSEPTPAPISTPLSHDDLASQEFQKALAELEEDDRARDPSSRSAAARAKSAHDSIYPSEMSCRQAFDEAYYCASMGGQFMSLYRYGELRQCSDHWNSFWFCMRVKGYGDEKRQAMIRQHYREKAAKYKTGPSSEDIWKARKEPIKQAFHLDPEAEQ